MNEELAIQIITEALDLATKKGCYGLLEMTNIMNALNFLNTPKSFEKNEDNE